MILPDTLRPLPVAADEPSAGDLSAGWDEDFVSVGAVRKVLLGDSSGAAAAPVGMLSARDIGCFAGRADVPVPEAEDILIAEDVFDRLFSGAPSAGDRRMPAAAFDRIEIHPAFRVMASDRRAAAPTVPLSADWESGFGRPRGGERWWIYGMALSLVAILLSGVLVDFLSRQGAAPESIRPAPVVPAATSPALAPSEVAALRESD